MQPCMNDRKQARARVRICQLMIKFSKNAMVIKRFQTFFFFSFFSFRLFMFACCTLINDYTFCKKKAHKHTQCRHQFNMLVQHICKYWGHFRTFKICNLWKQKIAIDCGSQFNWNSQWPFYNGIFQQILQKKKTKLN